MNIFFQRRNMNKTNKSFKLKNKHKREEEVII